MGKKDLEGVVAVYIEKERDERETRLIFKLKPSAISTLQKSSIQATDVLLPE